MGKKMPVLTDALTAGSAFSGIGGMDLGFALAGFRVIWQSEIDPYACRVLDKQWPTVPNLGDITKIDWSTVERPHLLFGGFPCQDISSARTRNKRYGLHGDKSGLYWSLSDGIAALKPRWVVIENSPEWRTWMPYVRADLHGRGYASTGLLLSAGSFGATHKRPRGVVVAHADGESEPLRAIHEEVARLSPVPRRHLPGLPLPRPVGVDDGIPGRMDRLRCLGNAAFPKVFEWMGRRIIEADIHDRIIAEEGRCVHFEEPFPYWECRAEAGLGQLTPPAERSD